MHPSNWSVDVNASAAKLCKVILIKVNSHLITIYYKKINLKRILQAARRDRALADDLVFMDCANRRNCLGVVRGIAAGVKTRAV